MLLDLDVQLGLARSLKQRGDDWEKAGGMNAQQLEFHARVRRSYLDQADAHGWAVLDATQPPQVLSDSAWKRVEPEIEARTLRPAAQAVQPPLPLAGTITADTPAIMAAATLQEPPTDRAERA